MDARAHDADLDVGTVLTFLVAAFGISWTVAAVLFAAGVDVTGASAIGPLLAFMFGPAVAAVLVRYRRGDDLRTGLGLFRGRLRWLLVAWLVPVGLVGATIGLGTLLPGVEFTSDLGAYLAEQGLSQEEVDATMAELEAVPVPTSVLFLGSALLAGATVNAVVALGEELGWRGLLLDELAPLGFWRLSTATGVVWGLWHAPIVAAGYNFPDSSPLVAVATMTLATVALSPIYTYVVVRAGSVLPAAVLHGTFNAAGGFALVYLSGAANVWIAPVGLAGIGAAVLATAACVAHDRFVADESITTGAAISPWTATSLTETDDDATVGGERTTG